MEQTALNFEVFQTVLLFCIFMFMPKDIFGRRR